MPHVDLVEGKNGRYGEARESVSESSRLLAWLLTYAFQTATVSIMSIMIVSAERNQVVNNAHQ